MLDFIFFFLGDISVLRANGIFSALEKLTYEYVPSECEQKDEVILYLQLQCFPSGELNWDLLSVRTNLTSVTSSLAQL